MTDLTVAETILSQLGGNRFLAMTGAKNLVGDGSGLTFKIGRNPKGITHARITLTAMDDYQIEFLAVRGANVKPVAFAEGILAENLAHAFKAKAGLDTSL